jgi:hypothetical protein
VSWLPGTPDDAPDVATAALALLAPTGAMAERLRSDARDACPGRTAAIITARVEGLITGSGSLAAFAPLTDAEEALVAVVEQFVIDPHGMDDATFGRLGRSYETADQVAMLFHLALADGFTKLSTVLADPSDEPSRKMVREDQG